MPPVLDTAATPIVQIIPQIRKEIENILFNVSVTSKPELNGVLTSTSGTQLDPSKSLRTMMTHNQHDCMDAT